MKRLLFIVLIAVLGLTACGPTPEELVGHGKKHLENENCAEAVNCFEKASKKGNAEAMYELGNMFYSGCCVDEDKEKAAEWYKKAAEIDYPEAQNKLADMYYQGIGVPQDFEKAANWAMKAAAYDMVESQFVLASLYYVGKGVPQDYDKAAESFLKVEEKGGDLAKKAQIILSVCYLKGLGVPQSDEKAVEMMCKDSDLSLAEAQRKIGIFYNYGSEVMDIARDIDQAVKWYRKAAENGDAVAQNRLGVAYYEGISVKKNVKEAKYWWKKAADQGDEDAKENLRMLAMAEKRAREANKTYILKGVSFEMVFVKGGTFTMGATPEQGSDAVRDEYPAHSVTLSDYYIGKFEVTQELWRAVMGYNPSSFKGNNLPVENVSWNDIEMFIIMLNEKTGANFRLPTEAEWEYAARGGNKSKGYKYSGSDRIDDVAWYLCNNTHAVGTKLPNELGIYDMSGNVWEYCQDWYGDYSSSSMTNPTGPSSGTFRILRGGSWDMYAEYSRVSLRNVRQPNDHSATKGFRLVLVP